MRRAPFPVVSDPPSPCFLSYSLSLCIGSVFKTASRRRKEERCHRPTAPRIPLSLSLSVCVHARCSRTIAH